MRELTVRIKYTTAALGNQKLRDGSGRFVFSRSPEGNVLFLPSWHHANMRLASKLLGRHQGQVRKIFWDINVDGCVRPPRWHRVYRDSGEGEGSERRYTLHEAFFPGQIIGINCAVPGSISDDDFWRLMQKAGQYKGLSPWQPGEYGFYEVVSIRPRQAPKEDEGNHEEERPEWDWPLEKPVQQQRKKRARGR